MIIDFVTLFPESVLAGIRHSILARAEADGAVTFRGWNPRDYATDAHRTVDDKPFGGGPGMVMKPDIVWQAVSAAMEPAEEGAQVLVFEPWGERFDQSKAQELSTAAQLVMVCGHYEGLDARIAERAGARVISMGDFVLTGGELPAMMVADAIVRLLPGVLGCAGSLEIDSHSGGLLSAPQYTRPWEFGGLTPPEVLRSGDHAAVERWKRQQSLQLTRKNRPDLFAMAHLESSDLDLLN